LLGEVDTNIPAPLPRASKNRAPERRRARALSPAPEAREPVAKKVKFSDALGPPTPSGDVYMDDDAGFAPMSDDPAPVKDEPMSDPVLPSSPTTKAAVRKAIKANTEEEDVDDVMEVAHAGAVSTASVNLSATRQVKKAVKADPYPSPANSSPTKGPVADVEAASWNDIHQKLNVVSSSPTETRSVGKIDHKDAIEADGSLNFYWTDYTEVNGSLCLFGKVLNKKTQSFVSCFVKVDNILRKLYFLPRQHRVKDKEETDEEVEMMDVYAEVDAMMDKMGVKMHKIKACTRKYAFELRDIPREGQYMKLLYPYTSKLAL
jgi:DNA polymerase alpha subunit A